MLGEDESARPDAGVDREHGLLAAKDPHTDITASSSPSSDEEPLSRGRFAVLAAVFCIIFGAKLALIAVLASRVPLVDQWDAEAAKLYSPYLKGELTFVNLLGPHNEHRIFCTRILALMHLELAGEWNTLLEMILDAVVHTVLITWLLALMLTLVTPRRRLLLASFTALLFAVPIGYENTLWGFQSQLYFTLLFGVAALSPLAAAHPFSVRWFGGLTAAILSYLSFATGVATILAAGFMVSLQLATGSRGRSRREVAGLVVIWLIAVAAILLAAASAVPDSTPATFVRGLSLLFGLTAAGLIPTGWYSWRLLRNRVAVSARAWLVVGMTIWISILLILIAYGRGAVFAVRYLDIILLIYPVALVAMFALADISPPQRFKNYAFRCAGTWVFVVAIYGVLGIYASVVGVLDWSRAARQQAENVRNYYATGRLDELEAKGATSANLAYPNPQRLARILDDPAIKAILPADVRPAGGDVGGIRNRLQLKGALADSTATAIRVVLAAGPGLLALGVCVLFAVAMRMVLPASKR